MADVRPGVKVGSYRIEEQLGVGAMGEVYRAVDEALGRRVALKILAEAHRDSSELHERFLREARAVAAVEHPNVVNIFAVGEWDRRPYFAMEYLPGPDLGAVVRRRGPLVDAETAAALLHAARGLREAAARGVIHRDVKPSNLVLTSRGEVKVTDFGLAKATDIGPGLTQSGIVVGTPDYIAPEQARGEPLDMRADIYALGCTLYHLVSGNAPYRREDEPETRYMEVVMRHLRDPVPDLETAAPRGCDSELAALCTRMMAKQPAERPGYDDVVDVLEAVVARLQGRLPRPDATPRSSPRERATRSERPARARANPSSPPDASSIVVRLPRAIPGWLWTITVMSALVFLVGLVLKLSGSR